MVTKGQDSTLMEESKTKTVRASCTVVSPALTGQKNRAAPPRGLTCLLEGRLRAAAPWYLSGLSSGQVCQGVRAPAPGSRSPGGRSGSEAGWRVWRNGKAAKVILKTRVGNPASREVTEMVLTFILGKHLPLISA